ncbi:hypothetical protein ACFL3Q_00120 [Planctomycetota bacterium]
MAGKHNEIEKRLWDAADDEAHFESQIVRIFSSGTRIDISLIDDLW